MACHGQQAKAAVASQPRPASQGTCGQPAKAIASQPRQRPSQGQGPWEASEIFVFWSLLKTIFRKIPTSKYFLKIDHF